MPQTVDVVRIVYQPNIVISSCERFDKVILVRFLVREQPVVDHPVFLRREDVCPDWKKVAVAVNEAEGQLHEKKLSVFSCKFSDETENHERVRKTIFSFILRYLARNFDCRDGF